MMGILSFEKPMGPILTRILFYLALIYVLWTGLQHLWDWILYFDDDWDKALWGVITTPIGVLIKILILRVVAEVILAQFRMDKSLHDQVTGKVAKPD